MKQVNPLFQLADVVIVDGHKAKILEIKVTDDEFDYLCEPLEPRVKLCGCPPEDTDCGGAAGWFLEHEVRK